MDRAVIAACVQAEPVVFDREATLDKLEALAPRRPGTAPSSSSSRRRSCPVYPSSRWAKAFAGWQNDGREGDVRADRPELGRGRRAGERGSAPSPSELGIWLVTGVNEVEPERPGTIYNSLLYHAPEGALALHHRKLVPTNHERLIWGQGDGAGCTRSRPASAGSAG